MAIKSVCTIFGFDILADDEDCGVGNELIANRYYEKELSEFVISKLRRGYQFVDVGAHVGYYTLMASRVCSKVFAFEPESYNYHLLVRNILNTIPCWGNVTPFKYGLSNEYFAIDFLHLSEDNHGAHSLRFKDIENPNGNTEKIALLRMDEVLGCEGMHPKFVKIDVQGHEWDVIEGMKGIIDTVVGLLFEKNSDNELMMEWLESEFNSAPASLMGRSHVYFERA